MKRYLMTVYQPDGPPPPTLDHDKLMRDIAVVNEQMQKAGVWVFADALHFSTTATVVRVKDNEVLMTDGPYTECKKHAGGIYVIEVPDLDVALHWAGKVGRALTLPVEVRPFMGRTG